MPPVLGGMGITINTCPFISREQVFYLFSQISSSYDLKVQCNEILFIPMPPVLGGMGITINTCPFISREQVFYLFDNLILSF